MQPGLTHKTTGQMSPLSSTSSQWWLLPRQTTEETSKHTGSSSSWTPGTTLRGLARTNERPSTLQQPPALPPAPPGMSLGNSVTTSDVGHKPGGWTIWARGLLSSTKPCGQHSAPGGTLSPRAWSPALVNFPDAHRTPSGPTTDHTWCCSMPLLCIPCHSQPLTCLPALCSNGLSS